jgi:hypothetical protein
MQEQLPTTAWTQEVGQCREQLPSAYRLGSKGTHSVPYKT